MAIDVQVQIRLVLKDQSILITREEAESLHRELGVALGKNPAAVVPNWNNNFVALEVRPCYN